MGLATEDSLNPHADVSEAIARLDATLGSLTNAKRAEVWLGVAITLAGQLLARTSGPVDDRVTA